MLMKPTFLVFYRELSILFPWGFISISLLRSIPRYHALRGNAYRASVITGMVSHAEHGNQSKTTFFCVLQGGCQFYCLI